LSNVFIGTSGFAAAVLERMARSEQRPSLVITRPDRRSGRGRRLRPPPVAERATGLGIPLAQPTSVNDPEARDLIARAGRPSNDGEPARGDDGEGARQTLVVCAYGALIKEPLLSEHDILNVHPSLLPRWRGAAPVERALMAGDAETGVSIMRLTAGLDSGPVCLVGLEPIRPDDTYGSLAGRLQELGGELIVRALEERPPFSEQPEEGVTYAEKITPEDRLLDPDRPAVELERVVRALHPHIGARIALGDGTILGVQRAAVLDEDALGEASGAGAAGEALESGGGVREQGGRLLLPTRDGVLELLEVQPPGGRPMDAAAYLRGYGPPGRR
jgi:methionyl-tRNA formyltransferase